MRYLLLLVPLVIAGCADTYGSRYHTTRDGINTTHQDMTAADTMVGPTMAPTTVARPTTIGRADRIGIAATKSKSSNAVVSDHHRFGRC
jgi:hypothetical protein